MGNGAGRLRGAPGLALNMVWLTSAPRSACSQRAGGSSGGRALAGLQVGALAAVNQVQVAAAQGGGVQQRGVAGHHIQVARLDASARRFAPAGRGQAAAAGVVGHVGTEKQRIHAPALVLSLRSSLAWMALSVLASSRPPPRPGWLQATTVCQPARLSWATACSAPGRGCHWSGKWLR